MPLVAASVPLAFEQQGPIFDAQLPGHSIRIAAGGWTLNTSSGQLRLSHPGADPHARLEGQGTAGIRNWIVGNDPSAWRRDVPLFAQVQVTALYPGIDVVYHGTGSRLEYDFHLAPHADPRRIQMLLTGADSIHLDSHGDLLIGLGSDCIVQHRPVAYQFIGGLRRDVESRFVLEHGDRVRFALGPYDASVPLTIDPVVAYSSYLGGTATDEGHAVALDASGDFYIAGRTFSTTHSNSNVLLFKIPPTGTPTQLVFGGTTGNDTANAIAIDANGNIYLVGSTSSTDFPVTGTYAAYQSELIGTMNAFVTAITPALNVQIFSTYFGGSVADEAFAVALDSNANIYIAGDTESTNLTVVSSDAFQTYNHGGYDAFLVSFSSIGAFNYGTYIGGSGDDHAYGVAVDSTGATYVVGSTTSTDYPASPYPGFPEPFQVSNHGTANGFAIKLFATGEEAYWSTYLGGSAADAANAVALDSTGNIYIAGTTGSTDFPAFTGAYQTAYQGGASDGFVMSLENNGQYANWSTFLGSPGDDVINAIALDPSNNVVLTGATDGTAFPITTDAVQSANAGGQDVIVATLANAGNSLLFSTYFGGSGNDVGTGIAVDAAGHIYFTGITASSNNDFPLYPTSGAYQSAYGGGSSDAFFAVFGCPDIVPAVDTGGVTNAASFLSTAVSPGGIIAIFGTDFGCSASAASAIPLPTTLGGVTVKVNGTAIPLFYVGEGQINAQMPYEATVGTATLQIIAPGGTSADVSVPIVAAGPGIFGASGAAAATNQDGTVNSVTNGAAPGSIVTVYFTGQGPVSQTVKTGAAAPAAPTLATVTTPNSSATIGGLNAPIQFLGLTPGLVGLAQANLTVPAALASGSYPVILTIGAVSSAPETITVSQ